MGKVPQHWWIVFTITAGVCFLWRTSSVTWSRPNVVAKASIQVDLSLSDPGIIAQRIFNISNVSKVPKTSKKKYRGAVSRYMLQLYHRRPNADIVRALQPLYISGPVLYAGGGRILEFQIPPVNIDEEIEAAELLAASGMILRVKSMDNTHNEEEENWRTSRKDEAWRAFDVTVAVKSRRGDSVRFLVRGKVYGRPQGEGPILLLSYTKPRKRERRSITEDADEETAIISWPENRKRRKNPCRKRPLYVDFAKINYDAWIVAPPGYDAYQCVGRCFFPFGDHLNPTKHAIVQALVHGALQGIDASGKPVSRVCCVPTRLAPTSLLYLDGSGTLTYQYGYADMVVVDCGCR